MRPSDKVQNEVGLFWGSPGAISNAKTPNRGTAGYVPPTPQLIASANAQHGSEMEMQDDHLASAPRTAGLPGNGSSGSLRMATAPYAKSPGGISAGGVASTNPRRHGGGIPRSPEVVVSRGYGFSSSSSTPNRFFIPQDRVASAPTSIVPSGSIIAGTTTTTIILSDQPRKNANHTSPDRSPAKNSGASE